MLYAKSLVAMRAVYAKTGTQFQHVSNNTWGKRSRMVREYPERKACIICEEHSMSPLSCFANPIGEGIFWSASFLSFFFFIGGFPNCELSSICVRRTQGVRISSKATARPLPGEFGTADPGSAFSLRSASNHVENWHIRQLNMNQAKFPLPHATHLRENWGMKGVGQVEVCMLVPMGCNRASVHKLCCSQFAEVFFQTINEFVQTLKSTVPEDLTAQLKALRDGVSNLDKHRDQVNGQDKL